MTATLSRGRPSSSIVEYKPIVDESRDVVSPSIVDTRTEVRAVWQRLIDTTLMSWLRDPTQLQDDANDTPLPKIIRLSLDVAEKYMDAGFPAPDSIVPDPNGGIVFERSEADTSEAIHVWSDGTVDYMHFHRTRLVERSPLQFL